MTDEKKPRKRVKAEKPAEPEVPAVEVKSAEPEVEAIAAPPSDKAVFYSGKPYSLTYSRSGVVIQANPGGPRLRSGHDIIITVTHGSND